MDINFPHLNTLSGELEYRAMYPRCINLRLLQGVSFSRLSTYLCLRSGPFFGSWVAPRLPSCRHQTKSRKRPKTGLGLATAPGEVSAAVAQAAAAQGGAAAAAAAAAETGSDRAGATVTEQHQQDAEHAAELLRRRVQAEVGVQQLLAASSRTITGLGVSMDGVETVPARGN